MLGNKREKFLRKNVGFFGKKSAGFTLMEMVVVIAIFSTLILIVLNVFMLAMHAQRQTSNRQQVLANLRYIMETMAQKVRTSEIDYQHYGAGGIANPTDILALIDQAGNNLQYLVGNGVIYQDEGSNSFALTDRDQVIVIKFDFYINPITNPFAEERCNGAAEINVCQSILGCTISDDSGGFPGFCRCSDDNECLTNNCESDLCLPFNFQPRVTIILGFQSAGAKPEEIKTIYLQTTVSSRVYKR